MCEGLIFKDQVLIGDLGLVDEASSTWEEAVFVVICNHRQ